MCRHRKLTERKRKMKEWNAQKRKECKRKCKAHVAAHLGSCIGANVLYSLPIILLMLIVYLTMFGSSFALLVAGADESAVAQEIEIVQVLTGSGVGAGIWTGAVGCADGTGVAVGGVLDSGWGVVLTTGVSIGVSFVFWKSSQKNVTVSKTTAISGRSIFQPLRFHQVIAYPHRLQKIGALHQTIQHLCHVTAKNGCSGVQCIAVCKAGTAAECSSVAGIV